MAAPNTAIANGRGCRRTMLAIVRRPRRSRRPLVAKTDQPTVREPPLRELAGGEASDHAAEGRSHGSSIDGQSTQRRAQLGVAHHSGVVLAAVHDLADTVAQEVVADEPALRSEDAH